MLRRAVFLGVQIVNYLTALVAGPPFGFDACPDFIDAVAREPIIHKVLAVRCGFAVGTSQNDDGTACASVDTAAIAVDAYATSVERNGRSSEQRTCHECFHGGRWAEGHDDATTSGLKAGEGEDQKSLSPRTLR